MDTDYLRVKTRRRGWINVVAISDELDAVSSAGFTERLAKAAAGLAGPLLVDLSGLAFTDCSGARTLATALRGLTGCGSVTLSPCRPIVWRARKRTDPATSIGKAVYKSCHEVSGNLQGALGQMMGRGARYVLRVA
jgi:anti-anti-sigma factor